VQPIILDCDPGHDDAIAILLAARAPNLQLEGITTTAGNQTVEKTSLNALRVCSFAGIHEVPVFRGMDRPMRRKLQTAASIHGESGLDGPVLPVPELALAPGHAVDFLIERLLTSDGELILAATCPLTNVATAMQREPRIVPKIQRIMLMGGAIGVGNWTPAAEFNIFVDPGAAHLVFSAGCPVTMIGLEVTHQVLATPAIRARVRALGSHVAFLVDELLGFFAETYERVFGFPSPPLHDPCAVAYVMDPTLIATQPVHVEVERQGK
jgi:inosine-uridine nucleoside N-ribohydrolase